MLVWSRHSKRVARPVRRRKLAIALGVVGVISVGALGPGIVWGYFKWVFSPFQSRWLVINGYEWTFLFGALSMLFLATTALAMLVHPARLGTWRLVPAALWAGSWWLVLWLELPSFATGRFLDTEGLLITLVACTSVTAIVLWCACASVRVAVSVLAAALGTALAWLCSETWWLGRHVDTNATLTMNAWFLVLALVLCIWALPARLRVRAEGHCPRCAYDVRGVSGGVCPECGVSLADDAPDGPDVALAEAGIDHIPGREPVV